jgi:vitamin B12 transporter
MQLMGTIRAPQAVFNSATSLTLPTLASIVTQGTGAAVKQYGVGGLATFSLRGTSSHQNTILWNGFSLQNSMNGVTDLSLFQSAMLDKVAVYSGGLSALYGGGTIGGALLLEDQFNEKQGLHGRLYQAISSLQNWQPMMRLDYGTDHYQVSARVGGAWDKNRYRYQLGNDRLVQTLASSTQRVAAIHQRFRWKERHSFTLRYTGLESDRNLVPTTTQTQVSDYQYDLKHRVAGEYQYVATKSVTKLRFLWNSERIDFRSAIIELDTNWSKSRVLELEQNRTLSPSITLNYGLHYKNDRATTSNYTAWKKQERVAFWSALRYAKAKNLIVLAARQEVADGKRIPFVFSVGYRLSIGAKHSWSLAANRNYNVPTLNDLFWVKLGNPTLHPEDSWSAEVSWETHFSATNSLQLTHYQMLVTDWVVWSPSSDGLWRPSNILKGWARGLELQARRQWLETTNFKLKTNTSYQLTLSTQQKSTSAAAIGKQLIYIPRQQAILDVEGFYKKMYLQIRQNVSSKRYTLADNSERLKGYYLCSATLGYAWNKLKMSVVADNLWNEKYALVQYRPMPLRNVSVAMRYDF